MKPRIAALIVVIAILAGGAGPANADNAVNARSVLSKYIEWRGGPRFQALHSVHMRGRLRVGEVDGTVERWLSREGRLREDRRLGSMAISEATTGTTNWTVNASGQVEELGDRGQGNRRKVALAFADIGGQPQSVSLIGTEQDDGRDWSVVRVTFGDNDTNDLLIDDRTGELLGERITQDRATRLVRYHDWRMVSGIRVAFEERVTTSNPVGEEVSRFESIDVNSALVANLFERPAEKQTWAFSTGRHSTGWIAFEFLNQEQIFVPATVNGVALSFVLDSGADITILDKAIATKMGAKLGGAVPVGGTGGQSTMQLTPDITLRIGDLELHGITVGVMDLSGLAQQLGHPLPMIVGKELFNQLIVDIDFPNRRLAFHERERFTMPAGAVRVVLGRHGENRTIPVSIEGRKSVDFDFDLGSNSPLIVYPHYRDSMQLLAGRRHSRELSAGVGGLFRPICATLASIAVGGISIPDVPADFPDPANTVLNSDRMGGNIGLPVFSRFRMLADYSADALWLQSDPSAISQPFPKNRAGLIAIPAGDRLKVLMVAPNSPAERSGWKEGMEIVAIDGHKIEADYRGSALSRWAARATGTRVMLTLADNSIKELVLTDYF